MKLLRRLITLTLAIYAIAAAAVFAFQGNLIYFPDDRALVDCNIREGVEVWQHGEEQGLLSPVGSKKLVLFFHGNGDSACNWRFLGVNHLGPLGYDVLAVEYPGYGGDDRTPSKLAIEGSLDVVNDWVKAENYEDIYVMGYSLGSGAASLYAQSFGAYQVLLFAPYDSIYNVALGQGFLLPRIFLREDFDNIKALSTVDAPITILHGTVDQVIPVNSSANLSLHLQASGRTVIREVREGVGHNGLFDSPAFDYYIRETLRP